MWIISSRVLVTSIQNPILCDGFCLGGNLQLFLSKHLLHTAVGIMFLEMNVDFYQLMCAGYEYSKSHSL
jgi:hypothetical protein